MSHGKKYGDLFYMITGLLLILCGLYLIVERKVVVGQNRMTLQGVSYGGSFLILLGIIVLMVYYHTLSPYSKIRAFLEGSKKVIMLRKRRGRKKN